MQHKRQLGTAIKQESLYTAEGCEKGFRTVINDGPQGCEFAVLAHSKCCDIMCHQSMFSCGVVLQVSLCTTYMCMYLAASNLAGLLVSLLITNRDRLFSQCDVHSSRLEPQA